MSILFQDRSGNTPLSTEEKLGIKSKLITTMGELDILEQNNINQGMIWLAKKKLKLPKELLHTPFSNKFHQKLFGDVWKWAGAFRTSEKNIGIAPYGISTELHKLFADVECWISFDTYPAKEICARFHHRLVQIHAYPNGNGRHSRLMTDALAILLIGSDLDWYSKDEKQGRRSEYIRVLRDADIKNYAPLIKYFNEMEPVI